MPALENLEKKMKAPGYEEKVKDDLKKANLEKLEGLQKKAAEIKAAMESFEKLALIDKN
jgi:hypothetical protein